MNLWSVVGKNLKPKVPHRLAGSVVEQASRGSAREVAEQVTKRADELILGHRKVKGVGDLVDAFLAKNHIDVNRNNITNQTILDEINLHNTEIYNKLDIRDTNLVDAYNRVFWPKNQRSLLSP